MKICPNCTSEVPNEFEICWKCSHSFVTNKIEKAAISNDKEEKRNLKCLRCQNEMRFADTLSIHEGANYGVLGNLGHLLTNKESFDVYICTNCEKVEFFAA